MRRRTHLYCARYSRKTKEYVSVYEWCIALLLFKTEYSSDRCKDNDRVRFFVNTKFIRPSQDFEPVNMGTYTERVVRKVLFKEILVLGDPWNSNPWLHDPNAVTIITVQWKLKGNTFIQVEQQKYNLRFCDRKICEILVPSLRSSNKPTGESEGHKNTDTVQFWYQPEAKVATPPPAGTKTFKFSRARSAL